MKPAIQHKANDIMKLVHCFINQRDWMYRENKCPVSAEQHQAIRKIKRHVEFCKYWKYEQQLKMIKSLLPDFETIMPGIHSKKYNDMCTKLDTIKNIINEQIK